MSYENVLKVRYKDLEEISIRQEILDFISGYDFGEPKETAYVVKKIRRDRTNTARKCSCWDNIKNEGRKGCPSCSGLGYQNDEKLIIGFLAILQSKRAIESQEYKASVGRADEILYVFYTPYDLKLGTGDIILRPVLTDEGFIDWPLEYTEKYMITSPFNYRLDEGRLEYNFYNVTKVQ